jgi:hypothetical protein
MTQMCEHTNATILIAHLTETIYSAKGKLVKERKLPDDARRCRWSCAACGTAGTGTTTGMGLPAWVTERLASLPIVR